jgi:hypothetical protein
MKKIILVFCTLFIAFNFSLKAQTLSTKAISSSGGYYSSGSAMLSFTVAEMSMVQTFSVAPNILTQGFQQPDDQYASILENEVYSDEILIYPNPSSGQFNILQNSDNESESMIKIYNLLGQIVLTKTFSTTNGLNNFKLDITNCSKGIYILELTSTDQNGKKNISIHKLNLAY